MGLTDTDSISTTYAHMTGVATPAVIVHWKLIQQNAMLL